MEYKDPGRYIPNLFLLYSWGSLLGVPSKVPSVKFAMTGSKSPTKISSRSSPKVEGCMIRYIRSRGM